MLVRQCFDQSITSTTLDMKMKAMVLQGKASPFVMLELPIPKPAADEALVKLSAAALNRRDWYIQQGTYPRTRYPVIIGSDGAGVVADVGSNVSRSLIGSEVIINPSHNWGADPKVQQRDFKVLGFPDSGTLAEFIAVPAKYVLPKPPSLNFEEAAAVALVGLTAYRALFTRGTMERTDRVLVTGIGGGVAITALQFARAFGATVYVTSGSDEKLGKAMALGAVEGVNYSRPSWTEELKKVSEGFDLIIDGAAGPGFAELLDVAAPAGRIVVYGSVQGKIQNAEPARIFWKQLSILGSTMGTEDEFVAMLRFVERYAIKPVIDSVYPLAAANNAMERLASGKQFGKIVLRH